MRTSSPSMWKNFCASSTTLTSLWSGTPTPPRFNSIRTRKRAIASPSLTSRERLPPGTGQSLDNLAAQTIRDVAVVLFLALRDQALRVVLHQPGEVAGGSAVVVALQRHQDQSLESRLRLRAFFEELVGVGPDARQVEHLHAHGDQVEE